jgi:hypothetical protein
MKGGIFEADNHWQGAAQLALLPLRAATGQGA